jgi:hypothetical protein
MDEPIRRIAIDELYVEANLLHVRYDAPIVEKPSGQKNIGGSRPAYSKTVEQPIFDESSGGFYSLMMGREVSSNELTIL